MACQLEEAVQEINKLLALPAVNKEKIMVDKLNLAKQSIEAQMKLLGAQVKPAYQDNKVDESKTDEYIDNMLYKINPTFKIEKDANLFEKYLSGEVSGFGHYNSKENKIVIPVLPEFTDRNRLEYASKILYNRLGFKVKGSDHNYFQKRYGALTEYNTYDMTNWFDKVLKDNPDSVIEYAEGYYTNSTAKELLNDMVTTGFLSDDILDRVVRHEKIHAYTSEFLHENPEHIVTKDVKRLYREALAKMPKKDNNAYWRKNVDEFVAEAISNPEIRDMLKTITTEQVKNKASIFDRLVSLLLSSLGVKRGNIYSELLYALNNMPIDSIETSKLVESKHLSRYKEISNLSSSIVKIINAYDTNKYKNVVSTGYNGITRRALWFGDKDYEYSGKFHEATTMHRYIDKIARDLEKETEVPVRYFNSVLINEYNGGKGLGAHPDNEAVFRDKDGNIGKIASLTVSGEGLVTIFDNKGKKVEEHSVKVGDLYVMPGGQFQDNFKHKVDTMGKETRISLTFRHIPLENLNNVNNESTEAEAKPNKSESAEVLLDSKELKTEDKVYQLLSIYSDKDAPKIGGGMIDNTIMEEYVRDEDKPNAEMVKGRQDNTLKDMLPHVDGRTIGAWRRSADKWYKEQNRKSEVRDHMDNILKLINQIENEPTLVNELNWGNSKQEVDKMTTNKINEMALKCAKQG